MVNYTKATFVILFVLVFVLFGAMAVMYKFIQSEANQCIDSPLTYGLGKLSPSAQCACFGDIDNFHFDFNNTDVWTPAKKSLVGDWGILTQS